MSLLDPKQPNSKQEENDQCDIWMISEESTSRENILLEYLSKQDRDIEYLSKQDWDLPQNEKEDLLTMIVQHHSAFSLEEDE